MHKGQTVAEMVRNVLERQAVARAERTGESFEAAFENVAESRAGQYETRKKCATPVWSQALHKNLLTAVH